MPVTFTKYALSVQPETAFDVLALARQLIATGKNVIELEIGDSPFPSSTPAIEAGIQAIHDGHCHYGPSIGLPEFRAAASDYVNREYGLSTTLENIVAGPGAKNFEQLFCEVFLNPGDGVLVFSPHFPTYGPNIERRGGVVCLSNLRQSREFRPNLDDVEDFLRQRSPRPKAIFLNSPQNPTGGIAQQEDVEAIANLIRGRDVALFSDEPYDRMVWQGTHHTILAQPDMLQQAVAAYTFSKSFSMSGWRLGFAVSSPEIVQMIGKMTNTALSCVSPFTQIAGIAALEKGCQERDERMGEFQARVTRLVDQLNSIEGLTCLQPGGSFYAFPNVAPICNRFKITSQGLAMYLLEGADDQRGVACLGGESFGQAGAGFLRLSCAESEERLLSAVSFMSEAFDRPDRVDAYLADHAEYQLDTPYENG